MTALQVDSPMIASRHVVVVDDDRSLLQLLDRWLTAAGYSTELYDEFESARVRLAAGAPDILITDVRLGAYNGLHLVVMAKLRNPAITAIVLTGFDDHVLQHDAVSAGASFMLKPVGAERLLEAVQPSHS